MVTITVQDVNNKAPEFGKVIFYQKFKRAKGTDIDSQKGTF